MYNDTIKVANKIISDTDLADVFQKMNEKIKENEQICNQETLQNQKFEREYQHWTTKNFSGNFKCTFNFYDDTTVNVDNYNSFLAIFSNRLYDVKSMWIRYSFIYFIEEGFNSKSINQYITMDIYENKMNIDSSLSSADNKMEEVYQLIKDKILHAPEKYDRVIKKKSLITNKIGFAIGMIPSLVIGTLLFLVPVIRQVYANYYVVYTIGVVILAFLIGNTAINGKMERLYSSISPSKKYAGYDSTNHKKIYKDDIDNYITTSEIIIGKNIDNIKNRKEIVELENKYGKYIFIELIVLLVLSVVVVLLGKII